MAEDFQGVSCGENWYSLPKNLFASSPCSLGTSDVACFDWPDHNAAFSTSASSDDWNQDFFREIEPPLDSNIAGEFFNGIFMDSATSSLLKTLFDDEDSDQPPQQPLVATNNDYSYYDQIIDNSYKNPNEPFLLNPPFASQQDHFPFANKSSKSLVQKKSNSEPAAKRARIQTPSPLPTFKVRKEKLGDRVTALQQLVSPFGKTDTASVLHEAVDYIKFLHEQVNVLSTPYLSGEEAGAREDLRSRGLCVVPISSTFPVAVETSSDFWTPIFGESFR